MKAKPIEVFIAFTKMSNIHELRKTFNDWDRPGYEPVGIQVQANQFDKLRRVTAEGMARDDYIIADLGTKPEDQKGVLHCKKGSIRVEAWPTDQPS
jgi:hypothetical protein